MITGLVTRREVLAAPAMLAALEDSPDPAPRLVEPGPAMMMANHVAVSPNGRLIAFDFARVSQNGGNIWSGIGLFERDSGRLHRIPNPPGRRLALESFSPTGTHLVCKSGVTGINTMRGVALVELATGRAREVYGPASPVPGLPIWYVSDAAVQPGSNQVLIARSAGYGQPHDLLLLDPDRGSLRTMLPAAESSRYFEDIRFLSPQEILFQVEAGLRGQLAEEVRALGLESRGPITCRLRLGETPRVLMPDLQRASGQSDHSDYFLRIALARDGTLYSTSRRGNPGPGFSNQICRIDMRAQRMEYLTATPGLKNDVAVAADGSLVAFLARDAVDPRSPLDLWTLNPRGGAPTKHGALARVQADKSFFLP